MNMQEKLEQLLTYATQKNASDIHLTLHRHTLSIQLRIYEQMVELVQDLWDESLFEYVKFISGFDLTNPYIPQNGQFSWKLGSQVLYCRFSLIPNKNLQAGVIRLLHTGIHLPIERLTSKKEHQMFLESLIHARRGLVIACGPTNSGKTTTLHAILHAIAQRSMHKVVSLEDPIEIQDPSYLQLQINEELGFTYEKGIEELLRHDPDVIFIGETRNSYTAKMVVRSALTGSLAFTTLHASNALEAIQRLEDLSVSTYDLKNTLTALIGQRLYQGPNGKECIYEVLSGQDLQYALEHKAYPKGFKTLSNEIQEALDAQRIQDPQARFDLQNL
ncbi:MAG: competence protein ComG [Erysipelotrichaceae bacterium]|nr:competence protein ComG [Erysipelotrichaceae bacterium]